MDLLAYASGLDVETMPFFTSCEKTDAFVASVVVSSFTECLWSPCLLPDCSKTGLVGSSGERFCEQAGGSEFVNAF